MSERAYVLRKSVGPWSAGTRVEIVNDDNRDGSCTIQIPHVKVDDQHKGIDYEDLYFDIDKDYVVQLRDRTRPIPTNTRRQRRQGKKRIEQVIDKLLSPKEDNAKNTY